MAMRRTVLLIATAFALTLCVFSSTRAAANESYIRIKILDRAELATLTRIVSIADVKNNHVWAFATDPMLYKLSAAGYEWEVFPYPGRDESVRMASKADDVIKSWHDYPTYGQYVEILQKLASEHADICRLVEVGTTQMGRKLLALKITDHPDLSEDEPEVFYSATMHGNEPAGYMTMLRFAEQLLDSYGNDPRLTAIVNEVELWINPLANPDGTYAGGDTTVNYATRAMANGVNLNRNFPDFVAGDHPDGNPWAPETVAWINFAGTHHFALSANLHSGKEVVNYPWDCTGERHPENAWFAAVARVYATQAQNDGPNKYMTDLDNGITNGFDWFQVTGGHQDYMVYFHGSREVTVELFGKYLVNGNELDHIWQANQRALVGYIETALTGIRGIVTDQYGQPLAASVKVLEYPSVGAEISTDPDVGDYHRMLLPGTYHLRVESPGYAAREQTVTVHTGVATRLDMVL
jgi:hypothetical protein